MEKEELVSSEIGEIVVTKPGGIGETLHIVWPLTLAILTGAANLACGRLFLGQYGDQALAAVLPAEKISVLLSVPLTAIIGYSTVFVAQFHSRQDNDEMVRSFAQGLWLTLLSTPLFLLAIPIGQFVLSHCGHTVSLCAAEKSYYAAYVPAGFLTVLNGVLGGLLAGQGQTRRAGFCTICGDVISLGLTPILLFSTRLGIAGAALATVIGYGATSCLLLRIILDDPLIRKGFRRGSFRFDAKRCLRIIRFGLPLGVQGLIGSMTFAVFTFEVARCTPLELAANNAVFAVNHVFWLTACALQQGVSILTARYHGAGADDLAKRVFRSGLILMGASLLICFSVLLPFSDSILDGFLGATSSFNADEFKSCGFVLMLILLIREMCEGTFLVVNGALGGVGDTRYAMTVKCTTDLCIRLPLVILASSIFQSVFALWATMPVDMGVAALMLLRRWCSGRWTVFHLKH